MISWKITFKDDSAPEIFRADRMVVAEDGTLQAFAVLPRTSWFKGHGVVTIKIWAPGSWRCAEPDTVPTFGDQVPPL